MTPAGVAETTMAPSRRPSGLKAMETALRTWTRSGAISIIASGTCSGAKAGAATTGPAIVVA